MDLIRVTPEEAMASPIGTIMLVKSSNVLDGTPHWVEVTGPPVQKPHGLRPMTKEWFCTQEEISILDRHIGDPVILRIMEK